MSLRKRTVGIILVVVMMIALLPELSLQASAATSGKFGDNITWEYSNGTLTLTGTGTTYANIEKIGPWNDYSNQIKKLVINKGITWLTWYSFYGLYNLKEINLPEGLTSIGNHAFASCSSIDNVIVPNTVTTLSNSAFSGCSNLINITLSNTLTNIGDYAFASCVSLERIAIPKSVTSVGNSTFSGCNSLKDIYFEGTENQWNKINPNNQAAIPEGVIVHYNSSASSNQTEENKDTISANDSNGSEAISESNGNTDSSVLHFDSASYTVAVGKTIAIGAVYKSDTAPKNIKAYSDSSDGNPFVVEGNGMVSVSGPYNGEYYLSVQITGKKAIIGTSLSLSVDGTTAAVNINITNTEYNWNKNNQFKFANLSDPEMFGGFGIERGYFITTKDYNRLLSNLTPVEQAQIDYTTIGKNEKSVFRLNVDGNRKSYEPWNGSCYGMSSWSYLASIGQAQAADVDGKSKNLIDIGLSDNTKSALNFYQVQQNLPAVADNMKKYNNAYPTSGKRINRVIEVAKSYKESGLPSIIGIKWCSSFNTDGSGKDFSAHAIVAYGVEDITPKTFKINGNKITYNHRVLVYDCAYPNDDNYDIYYNDDKSYCIPGYNACFNAKTAQAYWTKALNLDFTYVTNDKDYIDAINYKTGKLSQKVSDDTNKIRNRLTTSSQGLFSINYGAGSATIVDGEVREFIGEKPVILSTINGDFKISSISMMLDNPEFTIEDLDGDITYAFDCYNYYSEAYSSASGKVSFSNKKVEITGKNPGKNIVKLTFNDKDPSSGINKYEVSTDNSTYLSAEVNNGSLSIQTDNLESLEVRGYDGNKEYNLLPDTKESSTSNQKETIDIPSSIPNNTKPSTTDKKEGSNQFSDVPNDKWYTNAVYYCRDNGYMAGKSNNKFDPNGKVTRATITQVLYAMEGKPTAKKTAGFKDLKSGAWYVDSVNWAASIGIVSGYSKDKFGPNDAITRQQMAAIMYQYAKYKKYDTSANGDISKFKDSGSITKYAVTPMKWAVGHGIISGTNKGLEPKGTATRAQIAVILQAFDKNIKK